MILPSVVADVVAIEPNIRKIVKPIKKVYSHNYSIFSLILSLSLT